jgi:sortase (surface protein transpeptidase)
VRYTPVAGTIRIALRRGDPRLTCTFENELVRAPDPPVPPTPDPGGGGGGTTGGGGGGTTGGGGTGGGGSGTGGDRRPVTPNAPHGGVDTGLGGLAAVRPAAVPVPVVARRTGPAAMRLRVPSVGMSVPVDPVGLRRDGTLRAPASVWRAGWWRSGARPGQRGPAVIVGHRDSATGPGAFAPLQRVRPGAVVVVDGPGGRAAAFRVTRVLRVAKDRFPSRLVYGDTARRSLRLVTCAGRFDRATGHHDDNLVVLATRVGPA